ncbi:MAG: signal peptide peptidase SppA [Flavobacteriales bacterium]|nr:signal peptide peptidase SppA [Flavobacteriales bacterium]|tara:strand:- start:3168 stop:4925 length:1758 start_codon:yes stop_codon:yes gene_type:complete
MKQFFKFTIASALGLIIGTILLVLIGSIIVSSGNSDKISLSENHVLKLNLSGSIQDRKEKVPFDISEITGQNINIIGLNEVLRNIKKAKNDDFILGILLDVGQISSGYASLEEIRNALIDFKKSGKFITTYSEIYTQKAYYLASVANYICMYPEGGLDLKGINSTVTFFTNALKKMGIEPQVIRHGKFKSAVEPFMLNEMSDENRKQIEIYMGSLWNTYTQNIALNRGVSSNRLNEIINNFELKTPKDAVKLGLIDSLFYDDQFRKHLVYLSHEDTYEDIKFINLSRYDNVKSENAREKFKKDKITIIYAQGEIVSGTGSETVIGSERISKAIRNAREDEKVKAIVLRVNSPGGSALASDVIWREMVLAKDTKPVVVSMGDVAASGGYYIACASDKIYASPNTITGSIGVFGLLWSFEELFSEKLGLTFDQVKTNKFADLGSTNRPLTDQEYDLIQEGVVDVYNTFTSKVASGRKMHQIDVDNIGQGRVWSGANAIEINLIDEFGGLAEAIKGAAEMAGLEDYRLTELPLQKDPIQQFIESLEENIQSSWLKHQLGDQYKYYKTLHNLKNIKGIQARMPLQFIID